MNKITFELGGDMIEVIVDGNNLMFCDAATGTMTTIEGLKLNRSGVMKEHPDLEDNGDWRKVAMVRFKDHVKEIRTEKGKSDYVIEELIKFGYKGLFSQRAGFRPQKIR